MKCKLREGRRSFLGEEVFEQDLKGMKDLALWLALRCRTSDHNSRCKGLKVKVYLACLQNTGRQATLGHETQKGQ